MRVAIINSYLDFPDELWAFGKTVTRGMEIEIRQARKYGKTVKFIKEEFYEV